MPTVTTWYLEMGDRTERRPVPAVPGLTVLECEIGLPSFNRFLYRYVGAEWQWNDRIPWSDEEWARYVLREELRTFVAYVSGTPAGYYELEKQPGDEVEIAYFGLGPPFIGRGFGRYLLDHAIRTAWDWGASRVWVHTCTLDHPSALQNYQSRGMHIFRVEEAEIPAAET